MTNAKSKIGSKILDDIREGIMVTGSDGHIVYVNPAFQVVTGYSAEEVIGKNPNFLQSGVHGDSFYREMWLEIKKSGRWSGEIWNRRKNGDVYPEWLTIIANEKEDGQELDGYIGIFTDISDQKSAEEELKRLAHHDSLTGAANRHSYKQRLQSVLDTSAQYNQRVAVLYLDLDRFKPVNDTFGHAVGDQLLVAFSDRIKEQLGTKDFFARLGGDEFSIALSNLRHPREAFQTAKAIIRAMAAPFTIEGKTLYMSTSIGISFFPEDGHTVEDLLKKADKAMYDAKEKKMSHFSVYHQEMDTASATESLSIEMELHHAIDRGELLLHYQPKVSLKTGKVTGVEALVRWQHHSLGMISPGAFIPVAEETGLIVPIGEWVLQQASRDLRTIHSFGFTDVTMAVNISPVQFKQDGFVQSLLNVVEMENVSPHHIEIELTESTIMPDVQLSVDRLTALKERGFLLSIDDFGTGYSSLSYLKRFPIDKLKIDQSFIRMMDYEQEDVSIVEAIIVMAHRLGLTVVAEGVEKKAHVDILSNQQCDVAQGYFYSRPLPLDELVVKLFNM